MLVTFLTRCKDMDDCHRFFEEGHSYEIKNINRVRRIVANGWGTVSEELDITNIKDYPNLKDEV